ncbi:alpha/beta hydrolase [Aestuariivita sp.]|uniref:alpha/beta fold hydrolase n=1 Tax=Aestuariivita sp. TaxID=1872407 RepID=UPI00217199D9|nr:alpha/beta hydrolase [Aestuariivita sp.]MCE8006842.1 alpha/beta hydrolase [Aestuariivita sp.]
MLGSGAHETRGCCRAVAMLSGLHTGPKDAPSVVFLHGGGLTGRSFQPVADRLPEFHCFLPDLPGHGLSRQLPFQGLRAAADAVSEVIADQMPTPVHLVGLSLGGFVALHLMARRRTLVASALISGVHAGNMRHIGLVNLAIRLSYPAMRIKALRDASARANGVHQTDLMSDTDGQPHASPKTVRDVGLAAVKFRLQALSGPIHHPTLFVAGQNELRPIREALPIFQSVVPGAQAGVIAQGGHGWCLGWPDLAAALVRAWISDRTLPVWLHPSHQVPMPASSPQHARKPPETEQRKASP